MDKYNETSIENQQSNEETKNKIRELFADFDEPRTHSLTSIGYTGMIAIRTIVDENISKLEPTSTSNEVSKVEPPIITPSIRISTYIASCMRKFTEATTLLNTESLSHEKIDALVYCHKKQADDISVLSTPKPLEILHKNKPANSTFILEYYNGYNTYNLLRPGCVGALIAPPGNGKSTVIGAIISSLENPDCDSWGLKLLADKKVALIDTEQDEATLWTNVDRICRRKGSDGLDRTRVFATMDLRKKDRLEFIIETISSCEYDCVIIDGIADLVSDVNNVAECTEVSDTLLLNAKRSNTALIVTIHDNPVQSKSSYYGKSRGHLGSELTRKADFCLYIKKDKDTGIYKISSDAVSGKSRHCNSDIEIFFKWDDELMMHVSIDKPNNIEKDKNIEIEISYVKDLLSVRERWSTEQIRDYLKEKEGIGAETVKKRIAQWKSTKILVPITKGLYAVNRSLISEEIDIVD